MSLPAKKTLSVLVLFLCVECLVFLVKYGLEISHGSRIGSDFPVFWQAAQANHIANVYDTHAQDAQGLTSPFAYPPFLLFLLWPLGLLSYNTAVLVWLLVATLLFSVCVFGLLPFPQRRGWVPATIAACLLPFVLVNVIAGQTGILVAVFFLAGLYFEPRSPMLSGVCFGCMAFKPQFVPLIPLALAASGRWRTLGVMILTIAALCFAATLWLGPAVWADYLQMLRAFGQYAASGSSRINPLALGPYVSLHGAGVPASVSGAVQVTVTLAIATVIARLFRDRNGDDAWCWGMLACGTLLITPYSLCYDTPILAAALVPLLVRLTHKTNADLPEIAALALVVSIPFAAPVFYPLHVPFGMLALILLFFVLLRQYLLKSAGV